jgi:hypothetical protein
VPDPESVTVKHNLQDQVTNFDNAYSLIIVKKESSTLLQGVAIYRFDKLPEILEFELKDNTWIKSTAYWNQAPVRYELIDGKSSHRLKIEIPKLAAEGPYQLLLPFESQVGTGTWGTYPGASFLDHLVINAPRLTKGAWVRNTIWEVNLTGNDTLFETTSQADSLNTWCWNWFGISLRATLSQSADLTKGSPVDNQPAPRELANHLRTYRFLTQGPAAEISLITMNSLIIIFTGLIMGLILTFLCLNTGKILAGRVLFLTSLALFCGYLMLPTGMILWGQYLLSGIGLGLAAFYFDEIHLRSNRKRPVIVFSNDASSFQSYSASSMNKDSEATRLHQPAKTPIPPELSGVKS